ALFSDGSVTSIFMSEITGNLLDGLHLEMSVASVRQSSFLANVGYGIFIDAESLVAGYENTVSGNGTDVSPNVPAELMEKRPE
ncbi:hypothetical protein JW848_01875, partial [Candidatus Bipolaricaulota bacterium]|nr:hypothetical protein [Candidatus Bipolaricaulota bacterium]